MITKIKLIKVLIKLITAQYKLATMDAIINSFYFFFIEKQSTTLHTN